MDILNNEIKLRIESDIIATALREEYDTAINGITGVLDELHDRIPESKRISYGRVFTVRVLSEHLYDRLVEVEAPVFELASNLFEKSTDYKGRGVALGVLSFYALKNLISSLLAEGKIVALASEKRDGPIESVPAASAGTERWAIPSERLVLTFEKKDDGYLLVDCQSSHEQ